jgi:hypothetical protein
MFVNAYLCILFEAEKFFTMVIMDYYYHYGYFISERGLMPLPPHKFMHYAVTADCRKLKSRPTSLWWLPMAKYSHPT